MKLIDAHAHVFSTLSGFGAEGELRAIGNGLGLWGTGRVERIIPEGFGDTSFPAETYMKIMDRYNIEKAVLLQGGLLGFSNEYLKTVMHKYPNRFVSAAAIDPFCRKHEKIMENLLSSFHIFKFEVSTGCGLMGIHETFRLDSPMMLDLYDSINSINGIIAFDIGSPNDDSHQIDAIDNIAMRYPNMPIVICHLASPKRADKEILKQELAKIRKRENVFFDLAALMWKTRPEDFPFPVTQEYAKLAKDIVGIERLMWGTDAPTTLTHFSMDEMINCFSQIFTGNDSDLFFYENANRLYFS